MKKMMLFFGFIFLWTNLSAGKLDQIQQDYNKSQNYSTNSADRKTSSSSSGDSSNCSDTSSSSSYGAGSSYSSSNYSSTSNYSGQSEPSGSKESWDICTLSNYKSYPYEDGSDGFFNKKKGSYNDQKSMYFNIHTYFGKDTDSKTYLFWGDASAHIYRFLIGFETVNMYEKTDQGRDELNMYSFKIGGTLFDFNSFNLDLYFSTINIPQFEQTGSSKEEGKSRFGIGLKFSIFPGDPLVIQGGYEYTIYNELAYINRFDLSIGVQLNRFTLSAGIMLMGFDFPLVGDSVKFKFPYLKLSLWF